MAASTIAARNYIVTTPVGTTPPYVNGSLSSSVIAVGGCLCMWVGGYLNLLADTSGGTFAGMFVDDNVGVAVDGTAKVQFVPADSLGFLEMTGATVAASTWLGKMVYAGADDATVVLAAASSYKVPVGICVEVLSTTRARIDPRQRSLTASS